MHSEGFDLNIAVDRWLAETVAAEPSLEPHLNELADHVITESEARAEDGQPVVEAFAAAVRALGHVSDLADEFRKDGSIAAYLRRLATAEREPTKREQLALSGAWIGMSLIWAGVMLVVEGSAGWAIIAWAVTTYLPLSAISVLMKRDMRLVNGR